MGNLQEAPSSDARFILLSQDQMARRSVSASVPVEGGALIVRQSLSPSVPISGIMASSDSEAILTLEFTCDGVEGTVDSVDVQLENLSPVVSEFEPFTLQPGEVVTVDFEVDTSSLSSGQFVSAQVSEADIGSSFASVDVVGQPARAYVGAVPSSVSIDGAFGDWTDRTASDVDLVEVLNANIDIRHVGVFNTSDSSSFFISVAGEMCSGSYVPVMKGKPVPGSGGVVVPVTRKTAEDITRIFIDSDMSSATGYPVSVDSKLIGADYRIEVRGLNGEVVSSILQRYSGVSWLLVSSDVDAEVDWQRMELGVPSYELDGAVAIDFIIETTDWRQYKDYVALDEATIAGPHRRYLDRPRHARVGSRLGGILRSDILVQPEEAVPRWYELLELILRWFEHGVQVQFERRSHLDSRWACVRYHPWRSEGEPLVRLEHESGVCHRRYEHCV